MSQAHHADRPLVVVTADQDAAISFYVEKLGLELRGRLLEACHGLEVRLGAVVLVGVTNASNVSIGTVTPPPDENPQFLHLPGH